MLVAQYYPITIGENVNSICYNSTDEKFTNYLTVIGGYYSDSNADHDLVSNRSITGSDITIFDGDHLGVIGLDYNIKGDNNLNANITINGGEIYRIYMSQVYAVDNTSSYKAKGNVNLTVTGGTFTYSAISLTTSQVTFEGSVVVKISGGNFDACTSIAGREGYSTAYLADTYYNNETFTKKLSDYAIVLNSETPTE